MTNKRTRKRKHDHMILHLILLTAAVLFLFEGRTINILVHGGNVELSERSVRAAKSSKDTSIESSDVKSEKTDTTSDASDDGSAEPSAASGSDSTVTQAVVTTGTDGSGNSSVSSSLTMLAGLPSLSQSAPADAASGGNSAETEQQQTASHPTVADPDSPAIVPYIEPPVDDSYFADAVFIGDSRMEGFRNVSGITQGRFFTSVGMSLDGLISQSIIQTEDGNITVAAAVSGGVYSKIYLMLGTNDLGETDMTNFHDRFTAATTRLLEIQPGATLYVCSIIYVEEAKASNSQYVNNANVDKLNAVLLEICEEHGYHYLNLNEFLSDGNGSLIAGAASDGVHLYEKYCKQMLDYLKCHYVPGTEVSSDSSVTQEYAASDDTADEDVNIEEADSV